MKSIDDANPHDCYPEAVKLDLTTWLESAWIALAVGSGLGAVVLLKLGLLGGKRSAPNPDLLPFVPVAIALTLVFAFLRYFTDNHYILDGEKRAITYHFKCLGFQSVSTYLTFKEVHSVIVNCAVRTTKHSRWYEYQIFLLDKRGKLHAVSDSKKEDALDGLNRSADTLAKRVGCVLHEGATGARYAVAGKWRRISVTSTQIPLSRQNAALSPDQIGWVIVGSLLFVGFLAWVLRN